MATKSEKDKKIEALEAKLKDYEHQKAIRGKWSSISSFWKIAIVIALVVLIIVIAAYAYNEIVSLGEVSSLDLSDYQRLLTILDGLEWSASKKAFKPLRDKVLSDATGRATTIVAGENILLELEGDGYGLWGSFSFDKGYITGLLNLSLTTLVFSESTLKKGRALTLYIEGEKLVFYQED